MKLREAMPQDAMAMAGVHVAAWQRAYRGLVPDEHLQSMTCKGRAERFAAFLKETHDAVTLLAVSHDTVTGFMTVGRARDTDVQPRQTGEIWGIYVAPSHWQRGIGRCLLEEGELRLRTLGLSEAVLWVLKGNRAARAFYEKAGYRPDGAAKTVDLGGPLVALRYRRTLVQKPDSAPRPAA